MARSVGEDFPKLEAAVGSSLKRPARSFGEVSASVSGFRQPIAVYPFPINNSDRVTRRRQYLPLYVYIRPCLGAVITKLSITPFNRDFIAIVVLQVIQS